MARGSAPQLSEYELQRQANIAERDALLKQLALDAASAGLAPKPIPKHSTNGDRSHKRKTPVKKVIEEVVPRRTSSRLAGLTADSEVAKRKAEDEYVAVQEAARAKRQRVSGDLDLRDILVSGKQWDKSENFLVDVVNRGGKPYERTFGEREVEETSDKGLKALREQMSGLELYEEFEPNRIKITPERIYSLGFHPTVDKPLVFAGDKMGNLGIFDASQTISAIKADNVKVEDADDADDSDPEPPITSFKLHTRTIGAFQFSPADSNHLYTASYDSSIRKLDLAASRAVEIYAPTSPDLDEPVSGVEMASADPHNLYFSRLDGCFGRHDTRAPHGTDIYQLSDKKIGGFSLHPRHAHIVATASLDRYMRLWDLRKISGRGESRAPAMVGEHESRLSVSHAAFNAAGQVATASYDDTIKIHSFPDAGSWGVGHELGEAEMRPTTTIKHNNQTGRWVTILRPHWQASPSAGVQKFVIGNMNRFVDIYASTGQQLAQLGSPNITAVPAVAVFHPRRDWVAAGTASGKLCLWL